LANFRKHEFLAENIHPQMNLGVAHKLNIRGTLPPAFARNFTSCLREVRRDEAKSCFDKQIASPAEAGSQ